MAMPYTYVVSDTKASWANSGIALQLATAASNPVAILRAQISQNTSTASAMVTAQIGRQTAAATFTSGNTPTLNKLNYNRDAAATVVATSFGSAAVTNGTGWFAMHQESFNVLNGWLYLPVPQELIIVPVSGWVTFGLLGTIPSATWTIEVVFQELA